MNPLALLACLVLSPLLLSDSRAEELPLPPRMPEQFTYRDFAFAPGHDCSTPWIDPSFCEATRPQAWKADEVRRLEPYLDTLYSGRLEHFRRTLLEKGYRVVYRYASGASMDERGHFSPATLPAWQWGYDHSLNFSDLITLPAPPRDPVAGVDLGAQTVLHELVHAYADDDERLLEDFRNLVGWKEIDGQWRLPGVDPADVRQAMEENERRVAQGDFDGGLAIDRRFGIAHGFPSAYAMTNPDECLAELASFAYFDPTAPRYLKREWLDWLRARVLR